MKTDARRGKGRLKQMVGMNVKFVCTGTCGEDHPIHEHCKECHHSNFKTIVPYRRGKVEVWHSMLHGPMFYFGDKMIDPPVTSRLWRVQESVAEFGIRNCALWFKKHSNAGVESEVPQRGTDRL